MWRKVGNSLDALRDLLPQTSSCATNSPVIPSGDQAGGGSPNDSVQRQEKHGLRSLTDGLRDGGAVDGRMYWMRQAHVHLGQNAREERQARTVMQVIERTGPTVPILPASLKPAILKPSSHVFALSNDKIDIWDEAGYKLGWYTIREKPYRYLIRAYEAVRKDDRGKAWGRVVEAERIEVRRWLLDGRSS